MSPEQGMGVLGPRLPISQVRLKKDCPCMQGFVFSTFWLKD